MSRVIALLAPGQGAQTPGMLTSWLELDGAEARLTDWSAASGLDLIRLGTTGTAEEIKDTAVTQPLIVALTLLAYEQLGDRVELPATAPTAGHSVGELAAAAMAGVLAPTDAVALAAVRGAEMAAACALEPTGMSAVLGGDEAEVLARLQDLGLDPANRNGAGQIVAAGAQEALQKLADNPPAGARVKGLPVAGAFHTRYMASAEEALAARAGSITTSTSTRPLLSNLDGSVLPAGTDGSTILDRLIKQVTSPVRWDACMAALGTEGVTATLELPPGGTLTGLIKRTLADTERVAARTPADLDKAVALVDAS